jgi:carbamate kinase
MRIVIALGGNALTVADGNSPVEDQKSAVAVAAEPIADLVVAGHRVLVTHGNGPQVGDLLRRSELAADQVPPDPLDWCDAQTQATIGTSLMNALDAALERRGRPERTATLVSRTLVDADDVGFRSPSKPIGRHLGQDEKELLEEHGQVFTQVPRKGWRRVVASPEPQEVVDAAAADCLLAAGFVVVSSGGGGVPTVRRGDGTLDGVQAVVDKDLTAALVAQHVEADVLVIATDVEAVMTGWDTDDPQPVGEVTAAQLRAIAESEGFAAGSMRPKVQAVVRFVERTGGRAVITELGRICDALDGAVGTRVVPVG